MKLTPCNLLLPLLVLLAVLSASARTATLVVNNGPAYGLIVYTSSVNIGTNETATFSGPAIAPVAARSLPRSSRTVLPTT
jgi:hypothetical protein